MNDFPETPEEQRDAVILELEHLKFDPRVLRMIGNLAANAFRAGEIAGIRSVTAKIENQFSREFVNMLHPTGAEIE